VSAERSLLGRASVTRQQSAVVIQVAGGMSRVTAPGGPGWRPRSLYVLPHWKPEQLAENWRDVVYDLNVQSTMKLSAAIVNVESNWLPLLRVFATKLHVIQQRITFVARYYTQHCLKHDTVEMFLRPNLQQWRRLHRARGACPTFTNGWAVS